MSIGINISRNSFFLSLILLISQCSNEKETQIEFTVVPELSEEGDTLRMQFDFRSDAQQTLLLDWDALSIYDPTFEKEGLLANDIELRNLLDSISQSQFVIENETRDRRFFSDIKLFEGEIMEAKSVFSFDSQVDTLHLSKNGISIKSMAINVNRLKIEPTDSVIRLHYLFKPTTEQKRAGFKVLIVSSDWFKITS